MPLQAVRIDEPGGTAFSPNITAEAPVGCSGVVPKDQLSPSALKAAVFGSPKKIGSTCSTKHASSRSKSDPRSWRLALQTGWPGHTWPWRRSHQRGLRSAPRETGLLCDFRARLPVELRGQPPHRADCE